MGRVGHPQRCLAPGAALSLHGLVPRRTAGLRRHLAQPQLRAQACRQLRERGRLHICAAALADAPDPDLTVELITHRFTEGSREVLQGWYPGSSLEMDDALRSRKTTKFGSVKFVLPRERMTEMRAVMEASVARHLPIARVLYWT